MPLLVCKFVTFVFGLDCWFGWVTVYLFGIVVVVCCMCPTCGCRFLILGWFGVFVWVLEWRFGFGFLC